MELRAAKQPYQYHIHQASREPIEAAVILSIALIACAITIHVGGLERLYNESHGDSVLTFDAFNTIVLFLGIAVATFGFRRIAA